MIERISDSPDIRKQVEANQDSQKKLELLIPGLRGYREREDLRVADELLRNQVSDKLDGAKVNLEQLRKALAAASDYTNLASVGSLISQVQQVSGTVRHAQQGYAGFAPPIKIDDDKLNKLYDYDYAFVSAAFQLADATAPGNLVYDPTSPGNLQAAISNVTGLLSDFKQKWGARMQVVEDIGVK
ncbi:MAG: hypothetical protein OK422_04530 [Thaumarchaeota archaeon]|nr:hypothetical protein [Nitrososphaerota archaeon]